jgi:hypothetical protein
MNGGGSGPGSPPPGTATKPCAHKKAHRAANEMGYKKRRKDGGTRNKEQGRGKGKKNKPQAHLG